jgi:hypothetical protein
METQSTSGLGSSQASDRQIFGAQVVSKTLDYMNQNQHGTNKDYDFQTSVLGAAYTGKGTLMDDMI